jgi:hypothetical protein
MPKAKPAKQKRVGHRYKKGHQKIPGSGRIKGQPTLMQKSLKQAIMEACEWAGEDGEGKNGVTGYLANLAINYPKLFVRLLERLLPLQVDGTGSLNINHRYETMDDLAEAFKARGLPPPSQLIDVTPIAERVKE